MSFLGGGPQRRGHHPITRRGQPQRAGRPCRGDLKHGSRLFCPACVVGACWRERENDWPAIVVASLSRAANGPKLRPASGLSRDGSKPDKEEEQPKSKKGKRKKKSLKILKGEWTSAPLPPSRCHSRSGHRPPSPSRSASVQSGTRQTGKLDQSESKKGQAFAADRQSVRV